MARNTHRKLAAILAADVVGYSRLMGEDESGTLQALRAHREALIEPKIAEHQGRVVKLMGDGLLAEFPSAVEAVQCAIEIQRTMLERNADIPADKQLTFRIGINIGDIIVEGDDIYGDGVNVAARLEGLAEPGGICLSESVHTAVGTKLPLDYEGLGEQRVKNIEKPVRAYGARLKPGATLPQPTSATPAAPRRLSTAWVGTGAVVIVLIGGGLLSWIKPWAPEFEPALVEKMAFPLPDKPSIAVLPFANMSDDPEQEYFADGMTDDLITDLSKISALFVIARNSSFSYKDQSVKISQVAEELGVRYILEGSVRRAGDQVRINAQLIDATTGGHLWAERYDRRYTDIFNLQNELLGNIVTALTLKLTSNEEQVLTRIETDSVQAYDAFLQGWANYELRTMDGFVAAEPLLKKAIELDPSYSRAHAALAATYWLGAGRRAFGLSARSLAEEHLKQAMENPTPVAHRVASLINTHKGRHDEAITEAKKAILLDPNDPVGYFAMNRALTFAGRPAEAVDYIQQAMRLNPHYPVVYLYRLGFAQFGMERYSEAAATLEKSLSRDPDFSNSLKLLVPTYGHLNRISEAKEIVNWPSCGYAAQFKLEIDRERWCEGIRKAAGSK